MMTERVLPHGSHPLVSLITPSIFDFRRCSDWVYRYEPNHKPRWSKQAEKISTVYREYGAGAPILFRSTTPTEKRKLIELVSEFGKPTEEGLASEMIATAMCQYSDPGSGASIEDQQDFYTQELSTTPSIFLHALDLFFETTRGETQRDEYFELLLELRGEAVPKVGNPYFEKEFIKKQVNGMGLPKREDWGEHYERNKDIYAFFGLEYNDEVGRLLRIGDPKPASQTLAVH